MTFFHFLNCAALCFFPHIVYYRATYLGEYGSVSTCLKVCRMRYTKSSHLWPCNVLSYRRKHIVLLRPKQCLLSTCRELSFTQ